MSQSASTNDFDRGVELFNACQFFEAHEVWERVWKGSTGAEKILLQALIQAAAALLHLERGNLCGARSTWAKARVKFQTGSANLRELDLVHFASAADTCVAAAIAGQPTEHLPQLLRVGSPLR